MQTTCQRGIKTIQELACSDDEFNDDLGELARASPAFKFSMHPPENYPEFESELQKWAFDIKFEEKLSKDIELKISQRMEDTRDFISKKKSTLARITP